MTEDEIAAEDDDEPTMMQNAKYWDDFNALVDEAQKPWATPDDDTDDYRKQRAVAFFNVANVRASTVRAPRPSPLCGADLPSLPSLQLRRAVRQVLSNDIYALNPVLAAWVLHVLCFIVPRQIVELGDPTRRSCDACESFGAVLKKLIKHATCRRRTSATQVFGHRSANGRKLWTQTFKRGYIEQSFKRVCVRQELLHGEANIPFLQRADYDLKDKGRAKRDKDKVAEDAPTICEAMEAPWVGSETAALAIWS